MLLVIVTTRKAVRVRIGHCISVMVVVVLRMMIIGVVCIAGADLHRLLLLVMVLIVTE